MALGDYVETYVERDVRRIAEISNLGAFGRFLRLCVSLLTLTERGRAGSQGPSAVIGAMVTPSGCS